MWILRDISSFLGNSGTLPVQVIWGPRQSGKSSLVRKISSPQWTHVTLDDYQARELAVSDPALFLERYPSPLIVDEAQYAAPLFHQIKMVVDKNRLEFNKRDLQFRLTGSHQILMDSRIKESLAGRASYFRLHGLSVSEILAFRSDISIQNIVFKGGWPELYVNPNLSAKEYLNDYVQTVVEKDIIRAADIDKEVQFMKALKLMANRVGELIEFQDIAKSVGVSSPTIASWVQLLERSGIAGLLRPFSNNLNKRLIKMPKFYFYDVGLAARIQGHQDANMMMDSPQFGHLFENLVVAEVIKLRDHLRKDWSISFWRSKEKVEFDLIVQAGQHTVILDAQVAIQSATAIDWNSALRKDFNESTTSLAAVTFGGSRGQLSRNCEQVPIASLKSYLLEKLG